MLPEVFCLLVEVTLIYLEVYEIIPSVSVWLLSLLSPYQSEVAQFQGCWSSQPASIFSADQQPISRPAQPAAEVLFAPPHRHYGEILHV